MLPMAFHWPDFSLSRVIPSALLAIVLLLGTSPARAADPWLDVGFDAITPQPDPDLVVVRERAFESVDLSSIGLGQRDYVQSIYFRLNAGPTET